MGWYMTKVRLLENNQKVGLFTLDGWKVRLLMSVFPWNCQLTTEKNEKKKKAIGRIDKIKN